MECDTDSDISTLTPPPSSPTSSASSSTLSSISAQSPPPGYHTPAPSHGADEDKPPARKRRKIEPKTRTTQHLDLTSEEAQSEYDRQQACETLKKALRGRRKIVVIAGAGISVSAGIPDFRSSGGLFKTLRGEHKLKGSGKQLFDASVYKDDSSTSHFHDMLRQLFNMSESTKPTLFHRFLARLSTEGRLLRLYTQNVDGLETSLPPLATSVPLAHKGPWPQTIQLHGGLEKMTCQKCRKISDFDAKLFEGPVPPPCPQCVEEDNTRTTVAGKRSHGIGRLRPRIVLYNEHNPDDEAIGAVTKADFRTRPDAVVVVGTSMKIPGVRRIVSQMCRIVRDRREGTTIWINRDGVPTGKDLEDCWDLVVKGDSDEVARIVNLRDWDDPIRNTPEEYTDSEVEKVKTRQGETEVTITSPNKKDSPIAIQKLSAPVMTPPMSNSGDAEVKVEGDKPQTPIMIRFPKLPAQTSKLIKNPASEGLKISEVLKGNEIKRKPGRPKNSLNKKKKTEDKTKEGSRQTRLVAKVSKAKATSITNKIGAKKDPHSPRHGSDINVERPHHSAQTSVIVSTPLFVTPPATGSPTLSHPDTISPKGNVPKDMRKLLN